MFCRGGRRNCDYPAEVGLSLYKRAGEKMGAHLALVPDDMVVIPKRQFKRLAAAAA
jgi:hypothetical protein